MKNNELLNKKYSDNHVLLRTCWFLSNYSERARNDLGFKTWKECYSFLSKRFNRNFNSIKNYRDEFDPITDSIKKGWYQRSPRQIIVSINETMSKYTYDETLLLVKSFLSDYENFLLPSSLRRKDNSSYDSISADWNEIQKNKSISMAEKIIQCKARIGQGKYRECLIKIFNSQCALSSIGVVDLLVASHIKPWCDCESSFERLDENNGLLLSANIDKLFDKGYISFNDDGRILISSSIPASERKKLNININQFLLIKLNDKQKEYLKYHRENILRY